MDTPETLKDVNWRRRYFVGAAAFTAVAAPLGIIGSATAQTTTTRPPGAKPGTHTSFGTAEADRCRRSEHWICRSGSGRWAARHSSARLALRHLQFCRCRAVVGVGGLPRDRALSARLRHDTFSFPATRSGTASRRRVAVGHDCLDGCAQDRQGNSRRLRLGRANREHRLGAVAGAVQGDGVRERLSDRQPGGRTRCRFRPRPSSNGGTSSISPPSVDALGYDKYRREFSKLIWQIASPKWQFDDATFDRSAAAFDNPDHVAIVIHNYRWRLGLADGEAKYADLEKRLAAFPVITVPTITLEGDANGAPHLEPSAYAKKFSGKYEHRNITGGIGHNLPQEAPQAFAEAVIDVAKF